MKSYKIILFSTVLALLGTVACTDLEENILDEQLGSNLVNDPSNVQSLINSPYASLRRTIEWSKYWGLQEVTTDEVIIPTRGTDWDDNGAWRQLHLQTWDSDHIRFKQVWEFLTQGYSRANTAIYYISQFDSNETNDLYINEARFLRAYYMYLINDLFGQVPYRAASDQNFSVSPVVLNRKAASDTIISELKAIMPNLETKAQVGSTRATVGAAEALLAKVYLNYETYTGEAKWTEAIQYCDLLIADTDYAVADDYWSMFQYDIAEHSEFILRVPMDDNVDYGDDVQWTNFALHYSQVFGSFTSLWNGPSTTSTFFNTWDMENDARFYDDRIKSVTGFNQGFLVGQQYGLDGTALEQRNGDPLIFVPEINLGSSAENAGIRVIKFAPNPNTADQFRSPNDIPIMRISDIYLIRAEAKMRSGDEPGARADVNYIRSKRNASGKTLPQLSVVTLDDILLERGYELYWEGLRRQDLVRFGKFTDAWQEKPATNASRTIFPVPTSAADVNENLDPSLGN
ncbi:RagB/SusD family nutrient uptake outer membrane protein [Mangrovibacterium lignilyticum]|uniref:RagB/SusD family nutrient uptake outer membrane protein n=1 Tax=Mangrovibacterium lignilyticum TaxID=2668052 RepID=UPI0013D36576|nr:RagB/SusD family nutrient uptake outer membrane protein [Mangrovibacterium lignilyticum]